MPNRHRAGRRAHPGDGARRPGTRRSIWRGRMSGGARPSPRDESTHTSPGCTPIASPACGRGRARAARPGEGGSAATPGSAFQDGADHALARWQSGAFGEAAIPSPGHPSDVRPLPQAGEAICSHARRRCRRSTHESPSLLGGRVRGIRAAPTHRRSSHDPRAPRPRRSRPARPRRARRARAGPVRRADHRRHAGRFATWRAAPGRYRPRRRR